MKMMSPLIALLFLTIFGTVHAQTKSELPVKPLGTFMRVKSDDGEHAYGYDVALWKQGSKIYGLISAHAGLIGDPPAGLLENVRFDPRTKKLSFTAKLSLGVDGDNVPSHDIFVFEGMLTATRLAGNLLVKNEQCGKACTERKIINLPRSKEWSSSMDSFKTYAEWKKDADEILAFRGPGW
jgi:hypothetical protein